MRFVVVAALACLPMATARAGLLDPAVIVFLGNPIVEYYAADASEKDFINDLRWYEGQLHIAHGSDSTSVPTKLLYYDPILQRFEAERDDDGQVIEIRAEGWREARVFGSDLYLSNADPIGPTWMPRRRDGVWQLLPARTTPHSGGMYVFDNHIFAHTNWAPGYGTPPYMYWSSDDGQMFWPIEQPTLMPTEPGSDRSAIFFDFDGELYATSRGPYLLRYTGDPAAPFEPAFSTSADLMSYTDDDPGPIMKAVTLGDRLVFSTGRALHSAGSLNRDAPAVQRVLDFEATYGPAARVLDVEVTPCAVYALTRVAGIGPLPGQPRYFIHASTDGLNFDELAVFDRPLDYEVWDSGGSFAVVGADIYIGFHGGDFYRIADVAIVPEPTSALWLLGLCFCLRRAACRAGTPGRG